MSEATYKRYIEKGPDALPMAETMAALEFRDTHPAEAHRVDARHERELREAAEKDALQYDWLRQGGDERDFEAAHRELSAREKTERLSAMDREAREASARAILRGF